MDKPKAEKFTNIFSNMDNMTPSLILPQNDGVVHQISSSPSAKNCKSLLYIFEDTNSGVDFLLNRPVPRRPEVVKKDRDSFKHLSELIPQKAAYLLQSTIRDNPLTN